MMIRFFEELSLFARPLKTPVSLLFALFATQVFYGEGTLAFPTAEGFGAYAQGGRGGDVYHVVNLNDDGPGSLRYGIDKANGPRTIVFDVSGTITLESRLNVDQSYITIAGQTAPGDGICLKDYQLTISADHVIIRYIRARLGDEAGQESDAISVSRGKDVIIDHCSASWSVDEVLSCSTGEPDRIDRVTVQWCIIAEGLYESLHSKGAHGYGSLIRGCYGAQYSYLHNLYAHNDNRNPRPGNYDYNTFTLDPLGLQFDFRNNVMYNWGGSRPGYDADTDSVCRYNYVNNYGKPGPDSNPSGYAYSTGSKHFRAFYSGNHFYGSVPSDQASLVDWHDWSQSEIDTYLQDEPFSTGPVVTLSAQEAYDSVIEHVGASLARDSADTRVISDVINGTGSKINSPSEVGGWPVLNSLPPPLDSDQDGMPDAWETDRGLNPNDAADRNGDDDGDGYTNLEEYINGIVGEGLDPVSAYELWQLEYFDFDSNDRLEGAEIAQAALENDYDEDGYTNEYEYYFGLNPLNPVNSGGVAISLVSESGSNYPAITYKRREAESDATYSVLESEDAASWTPASIEPMSGPTSNDDGTETLTVRSVTQPTKGTLFRVKVEK